MLFMDFTIVFALLALPTKVCASWLLPKIVNLIYEWGPLVRLASGEMWNPSGVNYFLAHTRMEGCSNQSDPFTIYSIERCNQESYLTTKERASPALPAPSLFFSVVKMPVLPLSMSCIESITTSWKSPTGSSFRTTAESESALDIM